MTVGVLRLCFVALIAGGALLFAAPAHAQVPGAVAVDVDFDLGDYDPVLGDWPVLSLIISGPLDPGLLVVVEIYDDTGAVIFHGEADWRGSPQVFPLDRGVGVGDVAEVAVGQQDPPVVGATVPTTAPPTTVPPTTATPTTVPPTTAPPTTVPTTAPPTTVPPTTVAIVSAAGGGGTGSGGAVTITVIIAVTAFMVFMYPFFARAPERWRR